MVVSIAVGLTVAAPIALFAGAGLFALVPLALAFVAGFWGRQALRVDAEGVRYRALIPSESFVMRWSEITEVVVDRVVDGAPGSAPSRVPRARFLRREGSSHVALLFSGSDADPVIAACRRQNVPVLDQR